MNDEDKALNGDTRTAFASLKPHDMPWDFDDDTDSDLAPDAAVGLNLVGLPYIWAALRRMAWLWCGLAALGLVVGIGAYKAFPPSYQASSSVLLTNNPQIDPVDAMDTNTVLAQSESVATLALHQLGLNESVSNFQKNYTITSPTDQVLQITVSSTSSSDAVRKAGALAAAFLDFRTNVLETQQAAILAGINSQITKTEQSVTSLTQQISQESAEPTSSQQGATLNTLQNERTQAQTSLVALQQTLSDTQATGEATTQSMVQGSRLLNAAAPVDHSRLKLALVYVIGGLIVGLVLGIAFIVIQAIVSDRLRRRDDIAEALGAPVRLSVGPVRISRWLPGRGAAHATGKRDVKRIAGHLRNVLARAAQQRPTVTLAVVSVDNDDVAAATLLVLAGSMVRDGKRVVVSDLSGDARFARLVGAKRDGVQQVQVAGGTLAVAVPGRDSIAPSGPVGGAPQPRQTGVSDALASAYTSAELMFTLVDLDPSIGGEHLASWASDAVVLVTAGKSSATRIHGVGELVRLSGTNLVSAVVIGVDKADETLGFDGHASLAGAQ